LNRICSILILSFVAFAFAADVSPDSLTSNADSAVALPSLVTRGPGDLGAAIQAKLDSISATIASQGQSPVDSAAKAQAAKAKADSVRAALQSGKYIKRANYDKSNFDHWKVDSLFQKKMKESVVGVWRTPIVAHGHAFRDAELRFGMNDTLYGVTRTYSDSGRYQMTGEYTFFARYRFDNDSVMVSREVFSDRKVVRWDFIRFKVTGNRLMYHLTKLEFRDMNDNWLNALQGFENVTPEYYTRDFKSQSVQPVLKSNKK